MIEASKICTISIARFRIAWHFLIQCLLTALVLWSVNAIAGITFTGSSVNNANATSVTITVPGTAIAGDLLIAAISVRSGTVTTITAPAGWTLLQRTNNGTNLALAIYYKTAVAGDINANRTWSFNGTRRVSGMIVSYTGTDAVPGVFDVINSGIANSANITAPSVTPISSSTLLVGVFGIASSVSIIAPGTMTERDQDASGGTTAGASILIADQDYSGTAATGNRIAVAQSSAQNVGILISLDPAPVFPIAYYPLNEASWTGAANEVKDMSGNNLDATSFGGANTTPAKVCNGGSFNATTSYVEMPLDNKFNLQRQFSATVWIRPTSCPASDLKTIVSKDTNYEFHIAPNCRLNWWYNDSGGVVHDFFTPNNTIVPNQWNHIGIVYGPAFQRMYINGVLQFSATNMFQSLITNTRPVHIADDVVATRLFPGLIDEVRIYSATLSQEEVIADMNSVGACTLNHVRINHDGEALTCAPETVTVQACQDVNCTTLATTLVTTTLQPTGWVGGDTITFTGSTTAQLRKTTTGTVALSATATSPAPATISRCFNGATETCNLQFFDSGFIFDVSNQTACKTSAAVTLSAVRTDDITKTCAPAFTGAKTVNFWSTYSNPATGTQAMSVNGTSIATASPGTGIPLTFNAAAQSTFTVRYPDAGQMQLNARYTGSGTEAGLIMNGNDTFVSMPVGLAVYSTNAASTCASGDSTCTAFTSAGSTFPIQVKAACWTSDTDTDLSDNPATPNFRQTNIALSHSLVSPTGGQLGALGVTSFDMLSTDNGIHTVNESISEAGVFRITATPPASSYFGLTVPSAVSVNIGRFTPHHFTLLSSVLTNRTDILACTDSFTYMDEPLRVDYILRAENLANALTQNYSGTPGNANSFAKLDLTSPITMGYAVTSGTTNISGRLTPSGAITGSWLNGAGTVSFSGVISRAATPDGPLTNVAVGIFPADTDNIQLLASVLNMDVDNNATNDHARIGITEARFGRLRISNAYGSEQLDLPVPASVQYWNGTGFVDMGATDTCTTLNASNVALSFPVSTANHLAACETTVSLVAGTISNLKLTKPGTGNDGWANLRINLGPAASGNTCTSSTASAATTANKAYLRGNWGTTTYDQDPTALIRFGAYRSNGLIYFRENF